MGSRTGAGAVTGSWPNWAKAAGLDGAGADRVRPADRLDEAGGVGGHGPAVTGLYLPGGGLGIDRIGGAAVGCGWGRADG